MPRHSHPPATGLLLSGGLDSSILLGHLLERGRRVQPFYVRSHLAWEEAELAALGRYLAAVDSPRLDGLIVLDLPLSDVYGHHWSIDGADTPDATSQAEAVYLPGRNALLVIKAAVWCRLHGIRSLALGVLSTNPFGDAGPQFFDPFEASLNAALGGRMRIVRPFARLDKLAVMKLGRQLPLELTFSCIDPVDGLHCGQCNKCAERQDAFRMAAMQDTTPYALARVSD